MTFADAFLRCLYGEHERVNREIAEAEATRPSPFVYVEGAVFGPFNPAAAVSTKCTECGLDGNHDTWCPHWQPYLADES